ncbi:transposase [Paraburkholderia hospita]|uniref:transposase n=1 Tax=Paraburkholderia hospita TaxID=169430 RepID=UPI002ED2B37E
MFQDEARFGRISDTRRCWCPKPARPLCQAMVTQEYTYAYAAVSVADGVLDSLILPHVNGACMQMFLDEVCARHPDDRIVMVLDGAGWHQSASLRLPQPALAHAPAVLTRAQSRRTSLGRPARKVLSQPRLR